MGTFLWSGKDAQGNQRSERVEAENAQQARAILADRGWTDLQLIQDELGSAVVSQVKAAAWVREGADPQKMAELQAKLMQGKKAPGLFAQTLDSIKKEIKFIIIWAAILAFGIYKHRTWAIVFGAAGIALYVLLFPVLHFVFRFFATAQREYARLNKARVWGRWDEVLECVERLRRPDRITGVGVPDFELVRCRAQALVGLGKLDEGLAEFRKLENSPKVERGMYYSLLAAIYDVGRQFDKALELRQKAVEEKPDTASVWIDLAYGYVRRLKRPVEARAALAHTEKLEITGLGKPYLFFLRGIILWREHKPDEARKELEQALVAFRPLMHQPLVEGLLLLTKAHLCAVEIELGNVANAKTLFGEVEPYLIAHREDELLELCRAAKTAA
jgi:tetratricopeptide (TPR) repeat protein